MDFNFPEKTFPEKTFPEKTLARESFSGKFTKHVCLRNSYMVI
jgi:hypothetical protein